MTFYVLMLLSHVYGGYQVVNFAPGFVFTFDTIEKCEKVGKQWAGENEYNFKYKCLEVTK